ncbi:uncharacterized protein LOC144359957 [Saccoglossus kowalevskii]
MAAHRPKPEEIKPPEYEFDFCMLYHDRDLPWVQKFVEEIESSNPSRRGYFKERDSILGVYDFDNLEEALTVSRRTFVVLSYHTNTSELSYFEGLNALEKYLQENRKENRDRLVPLVLEGGIVPNFLRVFSTMEVKNKYFMSKIRKTLELPLGYTFHRKPSPVQEHAVSTSMLAYGIASTVDGDIHLQKDCPTEVPRPTGTTGKRVYYDDCDSLR